MTGLLDGKKPFMHISQMKQTDLVTWS